MRSQLMVCHRRCCHMTYNLYSGTVFHQTTQATLEQHVHQFTLAEATCNTDEWNGYEHIVQFHATVAHGQKELSRGH